MKFLVDESSDARLAAYLKSLGHDATTVASDYAPSLADQQILEIAQREGRVLIANDRDFGELVFRRGLPHVGVIFLRLSSTSLALKIARLNHVLATHASELGHFLVVTDRRVRVRGSQGSGPSTR
ncbi:MAG: DUF5615 family PIN-like protein [Chloroflexi bacterium]|nr:DUF5615 family PIN-like protein [Chloroflexota bacterium]